MTEHRAHDAITIHPLYAHAYTHYIKQGLTELEAREIAYAWVSQQRITAPARTVNHTPHALFFVLNLVFGGPIALGIGLGAANTAAVPVMVGCWAAVLIGQVAIWIGASRA